MSEQTLQDLLSIDELNVDYCPHCQSEISSSDDICGHCGKRIKNPMLSQWGKKLPIGVLNSEKTELNKEFDLIPLNWKIERDVSNEFKSKQHVTVGDHVDTILAFTVQSIGGKDISQKKIAHKKLIFQQMFLADVFYMYAYLRLLSLGKELKLTEIRCPYCNQKFQYTVDVSTMDVIVHEDPSKIYYSIKLRDGFDLASQHYNELILKPALWSMMYSKLTQSLNISEKFAAMFLASIHSIPGALDGLILTESQLEKFSRYDVALIEEAMENSVTGPQWEAQVVCPSCSRNSDININWMYGNFFSISYRCQQLARQSTI